MKLTTPPESGLFITLMSTIHIGTITIHQVGVLTGDLGLADFMEIFIPIITIPFMAADGTTHGTLTEDGADIIPTGAAIMAEATGAEVTGAADMAAADTLAADMTITATAITVCKITQEEAVPVLSDMEDPAAEAVRLIRLHQASFQEDAQYQEHQQIRIQDHPMQ